MKILVVDDSKAMRMLVAECLKSLGHELAYAENGADCLQYVADYAVDLILMDVEMPSINGIEATKAIREIKKDDWFPIIFLTTHSDDDSFAKGILAGGDAYLLKPLNTVRLQLTVIAMERIYLMRQKLFDTQKALKQVNLELEHITLFDQLTGLANRRNFDSTLERQFAWAKRNKSPLSVIIGDVDYFKVFNDCYGHPAGDECLSQVARAIAGQLKRSIDLACRYGGEEFTIILPETDMQGARKVAEMIRQAVFERNIPHAGSNIADRISMSLGVATYNGQYLTGPEITKAADDALYQAKRNGRNRIEVMA
ncbi:GGDEF domain-containing response regulator [Methylomonas methanica]|uniref:diguanylate cyclase n=1 Tax=Methylomonas methanica (strain DSM 25384 / MC09) TaxID=857087 RepID=F9ZV80_METMM|nr:diguanylate cyclase [Methylomonas methanica]AEG00690.1 response regulator receiver modulated diguanylate cyclase [Methylomonas methanica MC09]